MKYNDSNKPIVCMMKNSTCYKGTGRATPVGILWHSTAANNPSIARYVQPHESDENYNEMIQLLGKNKYSNDWNHIYLRAGVNAFIGKLADGTIATVQTLPWDYSPWGCGAGKNGSCNGTVGGRHWIQFEIAEADNNDKAYFEKTYKEACELTAYLCKMYNIDPHATVKYNGVTVPTILCHADSYQLGLGSNHGDVLHWFKKHGKTMDDVRDDVAKLMGTQPVVQAPATNTTPTPSTTPTTNNTTTTEKTLAVGDEIQLLPGAKYTTGKDVPSWVYKKKIYVRAINGDKITFSILKTGAVTGITYKKYVVGCEAKVELKPYLAQVTIDALNIRAGAGTNYNIQGVIKDRGTYTIVEESNGYGLLKAYQKKRNGWIYLGYTKKV